ncbi:hypothetical protein GCT13_41200 [Paraburkholderia sp. CNPSo 3157]|uniref:Uncharacterized protein n=1 Tax=Paraburkholderia franconis TaxID=2654983 RepID=A0A7X1NJB1_9BURK|nr:hypothetical protein [Paraburkholderia franconis]MPW23028.1 hypothetical protein [Paraburkholderia franconis]
MAEARAGIDESLRTPAIDSPVSGDQVTQGSIDSSKASGAITKGASVAQQPAAPVPAPAPVKAAPRSGPSVLASTQPSDDTDADASDEPQQGARSAPAAVPNSAAARADRSKQTGRATRHAHRAKPKETLMSRLAAMFRKVVHPRHS